MEQNDFIKIMFESLAGVASGKKPDGTSCEDKDELLQAWQDEFERKNASDSSSAL